MSLPPSWNWPHGTALLYCLKVAMATAAGFFLALGGPESAVYSAMSASMIVGASRGEDVRTSENRVRGTMAGMIVGMAATFPNLPPALAVTLATGATAYLCIAFGWGVAAARVGAALCAVMVLVHGHDAVDYSLTRVGNTLIGIAAGLAVSYLVLPVRGKAAAEQAVESTLAAAAKVLASLATAREPVPMQLHVAMLDRAVELEKAVRDGRREFGGTNDDMMKTVRHVGLVCAGTLTAAIAHSDLCASTGALQAATPLLASAAHLSERAKAMGQGEAPASSQAESAMAEMSASDTIALQGLALGLRKIEFALGLMGR